MKTLLWSFLLIATLLAALPAQAQIRYYVDADATGNDNGSSWTHALTKLQNALANAGLGDEIWVAAGTYYPDEGASVTNNDRTESFVLKPAVKIYGGFDGTESTLGERDVATNTTTLSGDINKDGAFTDNAYHVVRGGSADANALLDGFTITGGNANGTGSQQSGGGLFIKNSSPMLRNLTIAGNKAQNDGGGLFFDGSSSVLMQSTIESNTVTRDGGGIYFLGSSPTITGTTITGNTATGDGGGLYVDSGSTPGVTSLTIMDNTAGGNGGGIFNQSGSLHVRNTILWGNSHGSGSGFAAHLYNDSATPTVSYSIVKHSGGSGAGWQTSLGTDGGGNLDADPLLGGLADNGGATPTRMPGDTSPVIDAGSCFSQTEDQRGEMRPYDVDYSSFPNAADACDIGAVELQADEVSMPSCDGICYVDASATAGTGNGLSWDNAFTMLQSALAVAAGRVQIWVAAGTYYPDEGTGQINDDLTSTFQLINGVEIYGGFDGTETTLGVRDVATNITVLSGDIDGVSGNSGNAYHVVTGAGVSASAVLDGFTIRDGNADGASDGNGGGLFVGSGSPVLTNNTITGNIARDQGGGLFVGSGSPVLMGNTITDNTALLGGGLFVDSGSPSLTDNMIENNTATALGGGVYISSGSPTLMNNTISNNEISDLQAAESHGGGLYIASGGATLTDNTITNNAARFGGGLFIVSGSAMLASNIIRNNTATASGGGVRINGGSQTLMGNTMTDNTATVGGGLFVASGSATVTNNTISNNTATSNSGGVRINGGSATLTDNTISNNIAAAIGGGVYINGGSATLMNNTIDNNEISDLQAIESYGGGLHIAGGSPMLTNNTIISNVARVGGGLFVAGGSPMLTNCTITNNAGYGIYNQSSSLHVHSTILSGNTGPGSTDQIINNSIFVTPRISYSIIKGSGGSGSNWKSRLGTDGGGNLDAAPLLTPLQDNGGPTLTRMPAFDSPAIDAGSCFAGIVTEDQRGQARPVDNPVITDADDGCDIGAVELFGDELLPVELTAFTALADGPRVLLAWETASETNNAGFEVQQWREAGGGKGEEGWEVLVFVDGHGTTTEAKSYAHTVEDLAPGRHRFRLRQIDYDGTFDYSPEVEVAIGMDTAYLMTAPYPNPFNPQTQLSLMVKRAQRVRVSVYDMLGRRVAVLHEGELAAEQAQALVFEGERLASGLYMIRAEGETFVTTQRVTLVK